MEENGWMFRVSHSNMLLHQDICGNNGWYGFFSGDVVGSISAVFRGPGKAKMIYGNCWSDKEVAVHLNGKKISSALGNQSKVETVFDFNTGDKLRIEEDGAIIKIHSLTISCHGKYVATYGIKTFIKQ